VEWSFGAGVDVWLCLVRIPVSLLQKGAWVKPTTAAKTTTAIAVDSDDVVKENNIVNKV